jgi:hypothetical protein
MSLSNEDLTYPIICRHPEEFSGLTRLVITLSKSRTIFLMKNGSIVDKSRDWSVEEITHKITSKMWLSISPDEAIRYCDEHGTPTQALIDLLNTNITTVPTELTSSQIEDNLRKKRDEIFRSMW